MNEVNGVPDDSNEVWLVRYPKTMFYAMWLGSLIAAYVALKINTTLSEPDIVWLIRPPYARAAALGGVCNITWMFIGGMIEKRQGRSSYFSLLMPLIGFIIITVGLFYLVAVGYGFAFWIAAGFLSIVVYLLLFLLAVIAQRTVLKRFLER
jgi:hypothetical protein